MCQCLSCFIYSELFIIETECVNISNGWSQTIFCRHKERISAANSLRFLLFYFFSSQFEFIPLDRRKEYQRCFTESRGMWHATLLYTCSHAHGNNINLYLFFPINYAYSENFNSSQKIRFWKSEDKTLHNV